MNNKLENLMNSEFTYTHEVKAEDLATYWKNNVPVLATPILLWLSELACMSLTDHVLDESQMSVGFGHSMKHMAPTLEGDTVTIKAKLVGVEKSKLTYEVQAHDSQDLILKGQHTRTIINKPKFLEKIIEKEGTMI